MKQHPSGLVGVHHRSTARHRGGENAVFRFDTENAARQLFQVSVSRQGSLPAFLHKSLHKSTGVLGDKVLNFIEQVIQSGRFLNLTASERDRARVR